MSAFSIAISALCGAIFSASWWWMIDADVWARYYVDSNTGYQFWFYLAPIITSLGILLVNMVSAKVIDERDDGFWGGSGSSSKRPLLFAFIAVMLAGVGMAVWVGAAWYFNSESVGSKYPGQALIGGTTGLAVCGLLFKFSRTHEDDGFGF